MTKQIGEKRRCSCNSCQSSSHDHNATKSSCSQHIITCETVTLLKCQLCPKLICSICIVAHKNKHEKELIVDKKIADLEEKLKYAQKQKSLEQLKEEKLRLEIQILELQIKHMQKRQK